MSFYKDSQVEIHNGDSAKVLQTLPADTVDLTVTSPPYDNLRKYNGFCFDFHTIARELYRVTKQGGGVVWIVNNAIIDGSETGTSFEQALFFKQCGFKLYQTLIWEKITPPTPTTNRYYDVFEYMFFFTKGYPKTLNFIEDRMNLGAGKIQGRDTRHGDHRKQLNRHYVIKEYSRRFNVWKQVNQGNGTNHPAVFPLQLVKDHILSWSNEGDVVLDPFCGSGTTAIASLQTKRKCIGIEISEEYCNIIKNRILNETPLLL